MKASINSLPTILSFCHLAPVLFLFSASAAFSQLNVIVNSPYNGAPNSGGEGTYSREPFLVPGVQSIRYQQVFSASEFSVLGGSPGNILYLGLQSDGEGPGTSAFLDLEILFGITPKSPDSLSTTFAENVGSGLTKVHSRGVFLFSHAGGGTGGAFRLESPFLYDPAQGNLLVEIRTYSAVNLNPFSPGVYEAWDVQGDSVSRVYAHDVNAAIGITDSMGITMGFSITPVPEPSTYALVGLALAAWWWRHRRQQAKPTHS